MIDKEMEGRLEAHCEHRYVFGFHVDGKLSEHVKCTFCGKRLTGEVMAKNGARKELPLASAPRGWDRAIDGAERTVRQEVSRGELVELDIARIRRLLESSCAPEMFPHLELALDTYHVQIRGELLAEESRKQPPLAADELIVKAPALKRALAIAEWFDLYSVAILASLKQRLTTYGVASISTVEKAIDAFPMEKR